MAKRKSRIADYGDKTIKLTVAFWTNDISRKPGRIVKGEAWDTGFVYVQTNASHGLTNDGSSHVPFNSISEIPRAVGRVLVNNGVKLHPGGWSKKLFVARRRRAKP
jgi:hypothetical protein